MVKSFSLPSEAVLLRRMENMVFSVCCDLRAEAERVVDVEGLLAPVPDVVAGDHGLRVHPTGNGVPPNVTFVGALILPTCCFRRGNGLWRKKG